MRKLLAWLGVATLFVLTSTAHAQNDVLKPYVVLILDTSGSMLDPTGSGPTSCGRDDKRINHALCAINNIVNSYGDMVFSLARFRELTTGTYSTSCDANGDQWGNHNLDGTVFVPINLTPSGGDQCSTQGTFCADCDAQNNVARFCTANNQCFSNRCVNNRCANPTTATDSLHTTSCTTADDIFEVLTPLVDGNNANAALLTNGSCNSCSIASGSDPEIWGVSPYTWTPLAGVLNGSKRYWQGNQASNGGVIWPANQAGFDPINRDPSNAVFLPKPGQTSCNPNPTTCNSAGNCTGSNCCCVTQCRPYITVLLTDGDESCTGFTNTTTAATSLLTTTPRSDGVSISAIVRTANVVTITTGMVAHPFAEGDQVIVGGVTDTSFNGTFTVVSVPTTSSLTVNQNGANASSSGGIVRHAASAYRYRIETKPIGFGKSPGDAQIESLAHAGGAVDLPGVYEGYYAQDEADLELAISQILADSVRSESCNALDDDCDTRVDEDFPNKGGTCTNGQTGNCARTGTLVCRADGTGLECDAVTVTPGDEGTVCNQQDDDCDGLVDEGLSCTSCVPIGEICNNKDDDCDGSIDEGLTRACGQGTCTGTEVCTSGTWGGCTAPPAGTEICNGLDDDCDGICDGFELECSDVLTPGGPGTDNPGHPDNNPIPENICRPGTKTCPQLCNTNGNSFGACSGEVKPCNGATPCTDPCNGLDDDCDNKIDEDFTPADCSTNCGVGTTTCVNGNVTCNSTPAMNDDTCNNVDDDCDGNIDEDWTCANPINGMCPCGSGVVCEGDEACVNGQVVCQGGPINPEVCNCDDDDCDGSFDEGTLCPGGATCTNCQCAFACAPGEFPCPLGKTCDNGFCVNDPCFQVTCPPVNGNAQTCIPDPNMPNDHQCVDTCSVTTCTNGLVCYPPTGECKPDDCTTYPERCTADQVCVVKDGLGTCVSNPCQGVTCPADQYCLGGNCVPSCADVTCPDGQRCRQGMCETDPCGHPCPFGQACNDNTGECIEDPCKIRNCPQGQWCNPNDGQCEDDPCVTNEIVCPNENDVCRGGTCVDADDLRPDAAGATHVTVGGGGGCSTTGGGTGLVLGLALLLTRRRRRERATAQRGGAL